MTTSKPDRNDSTFNTPDPTGLQSEESRASVREQPPTQSQSDIQNPDEVGPFNDEDVAVDDGSEKVNPDKISRSATDAAVSDDERQSENLMSRQVGTIFHSGR